MNNLQKIISLLLAAVLTALIPPLGAKDVFNGRMMTGKAPVQPPMINIRIEVESWTTPDEIRELQGIMDRSGIEAFIDAFKGMNKGVVRFMHARGWNLPIHAAQVLPTEKGKRVLLFFLRQTWDPGSQFISTGKHYFMVIELKLNDKGKGEGRFYEDAQIGINPLLGKIEMGATESVPKIFPHIQEEKKKSES